jgi:hypothetical protein
MSLAGCFFCFFCLYPLFLVPVAPFVSTFYNFFPWEVSTPVTLRAEIPSK